MKCRTEFIGIQGAGKTTAAGVLLEKLRGSDATVLDHSESVDLALRRRDDGRLKHFLKSIPPLVCKRFLGREYALPELKSFCARRPALLRRLFSALEEHSFDDEDRAIVLDSLFLSFVEHQLLANHLHDDESVVIEEGLAQRVFTLFGLASGPVEQGEIEEFAGQLPLPDFLVWVDTAPETCLERILDRPRGPRPWFRRLERDEQLLRLETARERLSWIVRAFEEKGVGVIPIEGGPHAAGTGEALAGLAARMEG